MAVWVVQFAIWSADFVFVWRAMLEDRTPKSMWMMLLAVEEKKEKVLVKNPLNLKVLALDSKDP